LQPVQLVSMLAEPGEIVKVAFTGLAVTVPPPQPAKRAANHAITARHSLTACLGTRLATGSAPGSTSPE